MAPLKIQPIAIDIESERVKEAVVVRNESVLKSRLRRLFVFDRQLQRNNKDGEFEPSSVCLAKMVQNFMEEQPQPPKCGRNRCNCFNANSSDEDDCDLFGAQPSAGNGTESSSITDATETLKSLILCASVGERNLLADVARIVEKNGKSYKRKDDFRKVVADGLSSLGYDSSVCKSKWDKTSSCPAGEYEFIDVIVEEERLIVDVDFRSEFEIARSTGTYKAILQSLPFIFVGRSERLGQIVSIVSEAAKQSLKKKGMHVPPWRKRDYMLAKWLSPSAVRAKQPPSSSVHVAAVPETKSSNGDAALTEGGCGELELIFGEKTSPQELEGYFVGEKAESAVMAPAWQPPAVKPKSIERGAKVVTGLASLLKDKA
ncbi:uncharacterized protein LOC113872356 [Abrus precatorius]|uniref:Uncharacterized protein LOC113872356 n=1 Tax=Abrus precatorius TaxID=3816 RepID=A0A8B8MAE5_ABRPR|nr:uncharacterized protein LOC113872356 [Abrus precatorius]